MEAALKVGSILQGGKYRIIRVLGQGGFGITYEAEQKNLGRVAVKEFFLKGSCERTEGTSEVTVPTVDNRPLVERFRLKFIGEAQTIFSMKHSHIVPVHDVFEENGTAYYVMDYLPGGSLSSKVKSEGKLPEAEALGYIRQVAEALKYVHGKNTLHLDVKPANILLDEEGKAVLVDFGVSKHYDEEGEQTSSTPVAISAGYAPLEQYKAGDVSKMHPATDIYALGATLYNLVTGQAPPDASDVYEEGLSRPAGFSDGVWAAIEKAMQPRKKDRPQTVAEFLELLPASEISPLATLGRNDKETTSGTSPVISSGGEAEVEKSHTDGTVVISAASEETLVPDEDPDDSGDDTGDDSDSSPNGRNLKPLLLAIVAVIVLLIVIFGINRCGGDKPITTTPALVTTPIESGDTTDTSTFVPPDYTIPVIKVTGIKLSKTNLELESGQTETLNITIAPSDATDKTVTWKSSNEKIATVSSSGEITAKNEGAAKITASCGEKEATCDVKVVPAVIKVSNISLSKNKVELEVGESASLNATITPSNATDKTVTWKSSNEEVATVSSSGEITAKNEGMAKITASCGEQEAICNVAVKARSLTGFIKGYEWVDLGLSSKIKWATCNVGATRPEEYGSYFAWGEVEASKPRYDWTNYKFRVSGDSYRNFKFSKYVPSNKSEYWGGTGSPDNKTRLDLSDDAAHVKWGGTWRTPTYEEWVELIDKCNWSWTGSGYKVTSKTNGQSIFLPAAGFRNLGSTGGAGSGGRYWSSSLRADYPDCAWGMVFGSGSHGASSGYRYFGRSVRPVTE